MNAAQKIKEEDTKTRRRFLSFLGVPESTLCELISEAGNLWLEQHFELTRARRCAAYSKEFWAWWANQWAITDARLSSFINVDKAGVMHYSRSATSTQFIHSHTEFNDFYQAHHRRAIQGLVVPAELAARWVALATVTE